MQEPRNPVLGYFKTFVVPPSGDTGRAHRVSRRSPDGVWSGTAAFYSLGAVHSNAKAFKNSTHVLS